LFSEKFGVFFYLKKKKEQKYCHNILLSEEGKRKGEREKLSWSLKRTEGMINVEL
jgi:hypothetical protein